MAGDAVISWRLILSALFLPEGYKLCPPGHKVVEIKRGWTRKPKEPVKVEIVREDRP